MIRWGLGGNVKEEIQPDASGSLGSRKVEVMGEGGQIFMDCLFTGTP